MTVIIFDDQVRDGIGEVDRAHIEGFSKLWNLRPYNKTNAEVTRIPRLKVSRLRAFETNERRVAKYSEMMDPCFVGRNAAVLQYTLFAYMDKTTRNLMNNAATPKPGQFDEEWAKLDQASRVMRGRADLQEASLILIKIKSKLLVSGKLYTRTVLAPFGCKEIKILQGEEGDRSAGRLVVPKFPDGTRNDEQCPSS